MLRALPFVATLALSTLVKAQGTYPFDLTTLTAPDGSITAKFVSFGATLTELWVKDRKGVPRDVILGYDDNSRLATDPDHPVFNPIVGRYANRIKNGTFSIPIADPPVGDISYIPTNDHDGADTLHGGIHGWDRRNWTIVAKTPYSVTYTHLDAADEGFPGNVTAFVTHSVGPGGVFKTSIRASATQKTPIMLTQHIYWNLDAFQGSDHILNHTLQLASSRVIEGDVNLVPTGNFINVAGTAYDFRTPQLIGARLNQTVNYCGVGCTGYDNPFVYDRDVSNVAGTSLWSSLSGIRLDVTTNNPVVQIYTGNWLNTTRKAVHGGPSLYYDKWSAVAIEQEGYIDAINTPQWKIDQIYYPGRDYNWATQYKFSVVK